MAEFDTKDCFFHFTTRDAAFGDIVPNRRIRFSTYRQMRDPAENKEWSFGASFMVREDEPDGVRERVYADFQRLSVEIFDQAHLLALTVDIDYPWPDEEFGRGWSRARMWEQYAEQHQGVCLVFDRERFKASVAADLDRQLGVRPYCDEVVYTPRGSEHNLDLTDFPSPLPADFVRKYVEDHRLDLFFQKTRDWESEQEYRFVTTAPPTTPLYASYDDALVCIVVGENFPDWQRASAIDVGRRAGVQTRIMHWENNYPMPLELKQPESDGRLDPEDRGQQSASAKGGYGRKSTR